MGGGKGNATYDNTVENLQAAIGQQDRYKNIGQKAVQSLMDGVFMENKTTDLIYNLLCYISGLHCKLAVSKLIIFMCLR